MYSLHYKEVMKHQRSSVVLNFMVTDFMCNYINQLSKV